MQENNAGYNALALEEYKMLQVIAKDQEELRFKIRGWCVAITTALAVAYLSKEVSISVQGFLMISLTVLFLFLWLDVLYRVAQYRALKRAKSVEENLRGIGKYEGPLVRETLSKSNSVKDQLKSLKNIRVYGPYLLLLVIVGVISRIS